MTFVHETAGVEGEIGENTRVWHQAQIRQGAVIGKNCIIGKNAYIDFDVVVGDNCKIQNNVSIYNAKIEEDVFIGPSVVFTNDLYPRAFIWSEGKKAPRTHVKKGASIGANSTLLAGVEIGEYAMVGCGSVVTKGIPAHSLAYGNPARIRGFVCKCSAKLGPGKKRQEIVEFHCKKCGKKTKVKKEHYELMQK